MAIPSVLPPREWPTFSPNDNETLADVFLLLVLLTGLWLLKLLASADASEWLRSTLVVPIRRPLDQCVREGSRARQFLHDCALATIGDRGQHLQLLSVRCVVIWRRAGKRPSPESPNGDHAGCSLRMRPAITLDEESRAT